MTAFNRYKYLLAYIIPLLGFCSIHWYENWSWLTLVFSFVVIPILDIVLPINTANPPSDKEESMKKDSLFDWILYLNIPLYFCVLFYCYIRMEAIISLSFEFVGLVLSIGILAGTIGINVAHELGHRNTKMEQIMAKCLLMTALYMHFFIEHNKGHHKNVATPEDPATARKGESIYAFYLRSIRDGYLHAWKIEKDRLHTMGKSFYSWENEMLRFSVYQFIYLLGIGLIFGYQAAIFAILIAVVGILLLESINYVEHYGLLRQKLNSGRYEPQNFTHSWNSNHEVGRILLFELVRHSDHHYKTMRKYQVLRHFEESPQLPIGYPGSILVALIPPLWFKIMHPILSP